MIFMIEITYKQQCNRARRNTHRAADYFYLRSADRSPCNFSGIWELPEGHIFTAYRARYDGYGHLRSMNFFICQAGSEEEIIISRSNTFEFYREKNYDEVLGYYARGKFQILCTGIGLTYAPRLIEWWKSGDGSVAYAKLCAKYLKPRIKQIPIEEIAKLNEPKPQPTDSVLGGMAAHPRLYDAVLGGKKSIINYY